MVFESICLRKCYVKALRACTRPNSFEASEATSMILYLLNSSQRLSLIVRNDYHAVFWPSEGKWMDSVALTVPSLRSELPIIFEVLFAVVRSSLVVVEDGSFGDRNVLYQVAFHSSLSTLLTAGP